MIADRFRIVSSKKKFFSDGSNIDKSTGFGVFNENLTASYKLDDPASVYVAELAAIQYTLEIMRSVKYSPYFLGKIRDHLSALAIRSYRITLAWIPSHCSIPDNKRADSLAKEGALDGEIYERPIAYNEFFSASGHRTLANWQTA